MGFVKASGKELTIDGKTILLRGFGLGGWFLPEGYMWKLYGKCDRPRRMEALIEGLCGKAYACSFWQRYGEKYITEWDMELIAKQGFNSVRLPLNARHLKEEETLKRIDKLISWCKARGLLVILDMHGAPGGQTGTNIDDSACDKPELFENDAFAQELMDLWRMLARRYQNETAVAGYDLLNEPLPEWFSGYNALVLPLYRRLIDTIREEDQNHLIIAEGVHWATDFSIFDPLEFDPLDGNCMLQFHKYWSNPDVESIQPYLQYLDKLNVPLFMGEGGENNLAWYTAVFPMYERENISWSFWSYKKMDCNNSPVTFLRPDGWDELIRHLDGAGQLDRQRAVQIFDNYLLSIAEPKVNQDVLRTLKREAPIIIPAEHYDTCSAISQRTPGAEYRMGDGLTILFLNGKMGKPNYQRYGGEDQPEEENLILLLMPGDSASYRFRGGKDGSISLTLKGPGSLSLRLGLWQETLDVFMSWQKLKVRYPHGDGGEGVLTVTCINGEVMLDDIDIR
jgi:endoglucanase